MTIRSRIEHIRAETRGVKSLSGISSKDEEFMESLLARGVERLSEKQEKWLADIERRALGEDDDG